jgi:hypothetical protein
MPAALGVTYILPRRNALSIALRALADPGEPQVRVLHNNAFHRTWNLRVADVASFADGAGVCEHQHILNRATSKAPFAVYAYTK